MKYNVGDQVLIGITKLNRIVRDEYPGAICVFNMPKHKRSYVLTVTEVAPYWDEVILNVSVMTTRGAVHLSSFALSKWDVRPYVNDSMVVVSSLDYADSIALTEEDKIIIKEYIENV